MLPSLEEVEMSRRRMRRNDLIWHGNDWRRGWEMALMRIRGGTYGSFRETGLSSRDRYARRRLCERRCLSISARDYYDLGLLQRSD